MVYMPYSFIKQIIIFLGTSDAGVDKTEDKIPMLESVLSSGKTDDKMCQF